MYDCDEQFLKAHVIKDFCEATELSHSRSRTLYHVGTQLPASSLSSVSEVSKSLYSLTSRFSLKQNDD